VSGARGRVGSAMTWKAVQLGADRVISLVRFLVLARILAPEDFGLLAIATVSLELLMTITNFGMVPALIQRQEPEERHYHAAWTVGVVRGVAMAAVVLVAAPLIASLFGDPEATNLLRLIALRPLLTAFLSIRMADLERDLDFRSLTAVEVPAALTQTVVAIALAPVIGVYALVAGMLAGAVLSVAVSYRLAPYSPRLTLDREAAAPLFRYGRWILVTSILGVVGEAALRVVVSRQLGTVELGLYYLAARLVSIPNGVVSYVVGAVAFPLHARLQHAGAQAAEAFRANVTALLASLVPIYLGVAALAPALVRDVLGPRWDGTVPVIRLLALAAVLGLVVDAVVPLLQGRGRPEQVTVLILVRTTVLLASGWVLTARFGVAGAALAVVVCEVPTQLVAARMTGRLLPAPFRGTGKPALAALVASGAGAAAGVAVDGLVGPPLGVLAGGTTAAAVGLVLLAGVDRVAGVGLFAQLVRAFPALGRAPLLRTLARGD
jgi:O-antigen/teichoic acid export membrane protein